MDTSLLARLLDAARAVMPLAPINPVTLALEQLPIGQRVRAQVMARLADGTFRVVVNDTPLKLALPPDTKTGDVVTLRLVAREPQLTFDLHRPRVSAEPSLSGAARLIGQLLSEPAESGPRQAQPVVPAPRADATELQQPLARAIERSGLFYEAHQARWIDGDYPLARLREEPQAAVARPQLSASGQGASAPGAQPPTQGLLLPRLPADADAHDSFDAATRDPADPRTVAEYDQTDLSAPNDARSYERNSPQAALARALAAALLSERPVEPTRMSVTREASDLLKASADEGDASRTGVARELLPIVRQQLDAIETRQIVWQGELWPGQSIHWQITDGEPDVQHPESGREWLTRFALQLPALGTVDANLAVGVHGVRIFIGAADSATADALRHAAPELAQALAAAGLRVAALEVRHHER